MKLYYRLFALLLCCAVLLGSLPAFAAASPREDALNFLLRQAKEPSAGDTYGDWEIFALARSGGAVADGYYAAWLKRVDRGLTILHGEGGYLRKDTEVILSVVSNHELPKIERLARDIDPDCFMIVSSVTEVWGRGFSTSKHAPRQK